MVMLLDFAFIMAVIITGIGDGVAIACAATCDGSCNVV